MKSLQRRLFESHVLVMAVALAVLALVVVILDEVGEHHVMDFGRRRDGDATPVVIAFAIAITAAAFVSWRTTKRLVRPLDDVRQATSQLAQGRYDVRLPEADTTELNAVARNVNQLANELETTEARRLRLLGDVAHELRNPLSTIEGTMEALLDDVLPATDDTFARIGREAARLRRLADDLSSLSSAGELIVTSESAVAIEPLIHHVVAQLEPQAGAKGLSIDVEVEVGGLPQVPGDHDRLTQVLMNVVGNAIQYTESGSINVREHSQPGWAIIDVSDTGRGLTGPDQQRIFERFHRVEGELSDGTGVGLAIAKLIIDAHGGQISATSAGVGAGTTIRIALPTDSR